MEKDHMRNLPTVLIGIFLLSILTSCTGGGTGSKADPYFTGYDGAAMRLPPGSAPKIFYYYSSPRPGDNLLSYNLEVANKGAADTYGGVYISGYDPTFIKVTGVEISEAGDNIDCDWDAIFANHNWQAVIYCTFLGDSSGYVNLGAGRGTLDAFGLDLDIARLFPSDVKETQLLGRKIGDWVHNLRFKIDCDTSTPNKECGIGVDWTTADFDFGAATNGDLAIGYVTNLYANMPGDRTFINRFHGKEFALSGDRQSYPGGELAYIPFEVEIISWPKGLQQTQQNFMFTSCYVYTTYADPQVCIDPYPDTSNRKVCKPKAVTYPKGQGGPVAITSIQQENTPRAIYFTINIQNKGKGLIYALPSLHKCDPLQADRVTNKDLNTVILGDIRLANEHMQFKCQPQNKIRLDDKGKGSIMCEYPILYNIQSAYQSPLVISLWYGYSETLQTSVLLKRGN
jgi:hypothetical protein